ncbi:DMSO/selenate family reductase complex B subunit [Bacillus sp. T33-2]|uniref:DMSO/selenate family reductase complex B subunit n=1 Tax=Bacillus sp. T33-2 TaxID=2054168 RepID=UPI000C757F87|nr:DMSO/selenate family reductase complex B subunit [Bacillus sp. T33-2]PLR98831.1 dimethylsulfoxide reductase, chain B [Bacillus sp. T33-2]
MAQMGFFIDQSRCSGCKACSVACKDKNDLDVGVNFRRVYSYEEGGYSQQGSAIVPELKSYYFSISCNHCASPACLPSCPTKSITKREKDGVVVVDQDKCIGSRFCIEACPYGGPQFDKKIFKMAKCDTCLDLRDQGEEPVCVATCLQRAIEFGPIDELRKKYGTVSEVKGMPKSSITGPNLLIRPHRHAL